MSVLKYDGSICDVPGTGVTVVLCSLDSTVTVVDVHGAAKAMYRTIINAIYASKG